MLAKIQINLLLSLVLFLLPIHPVIAASPEFDKNNHLDGVTLDSIKSLPTSINALQEFPHKLMVRVVFDPDKSPRYYKSAIDSLHKHAFIMGELLDSISFKEYTLNRYKKRMSRYIKTLHKKVDIWEIGNEINGEWLGNTNDVMDKINAAYRIAKRKHVITALTFYYNETCNPQPETKMFTWIEKNIHEKMRDGLDYVFLSYYPDFCAGPSPNWQDVFNRLHQLFPNSKLGFGEIGTPKQDEKAPLINEFYRLKINSDYYIGGYFWWYFREDMVPSSKPLHSVLKNAIQD